MVNHARVHDDDEPLLPLMDHSTAQTKSSVRMNEIAHQHVESTKTKLSGSTVNDSISSTSSGPEDNGVTHSQRCSHSLDGVHERQLLHVPDDNEDDDEDEPVSLEELKESEKDKMRLKIAIGLCSTFFVVELVGGLWSDSLALLSDSFHLLTDITSFIISLAAIYLSHRPPTATHTFGYHRAEVLGALFSIFLIWALTFLLVVEAYNRVRHPIDVDGKTMSIIAGLGVFVNIVLMFVLGGHHHHHGDDDHEHGHGHGHSHGHGHGHGHSHSHPDHAPLQMDVDHDHEHDHGSTLKPAAIHDHGHHHHHHHVNLNITAATLHVLGDLLSSIGVLISSLFITFYPSLTYLDPICTFIFSILVIGTTISVFKRSVMILMERVPRNLNTEEIKEAICDIPGVLEVKTLHVWSLTIGQAAMAGTIYLQPEIHGLKQASAIVKRARRMVKTRYGIKQATIQVELYSHSRSRLNMTLHRVESDQTAVITGSGIAACGSKTVISSSSPMDTLAKHDKDIIFSIGDEDQDESEHHHHNDHHNHHNQEHQHHHQHQHQHQHPTHSPLHSTATQIHRAGTPLNQYRQNRLLSEDGSGDESESEMEQEVQTHVRSEPNRWA
ncbi:hypothetical protein BGZ75_004455 [Mortierella antarctica]|nr:hypothetical protein BGZ75_004455 [Mortierella antarctica]